MPASSTYLCDFKSSTPESPTRRILRQTRGVVQRLRFDSADFEDEEHGHPVHEQLGRHRCGSERVNEDMGTFDQHHRHSLEEPDLNVPTMSSTSTPLSARRVASLDRPERRLEEDRIPWDRGEGGGKESSGGVFSLERVGSRNAAVSSAKQGMAVMREDRS
ncbi:unnamed protein product [Toxocara canis]|uniref:Uncharacterized protein n=1 Tax=Toxocara canis TaxID=6265 RepID=A0A183U3V1_TOXCA|nr:unnamed protein product [Toxocara canis]